MTVVDGEEWSLRRLMTEVVGSGPKSSEDMTPRQARAAFSRILDGVPDPTTLGAFWLANRWKTNTPEELAAFVDVMRERSIHISEPSIDVLDCGANYDGKLNTVLLGVGAGLIAASCGSPVVVHSGDRVPTKEGTTYKHVLDSLGIPTDISPEDSANMVNETGFGFYYQPRFNPEVHALLDRRRHMGVRTFVNTIETLGNPADSRVHLGSFYHLAFAKRVIETIVASETLSVDRIVLFQGIEGYDELRPGYTKVAEWEDGEISEYEIRTNEYGFDIEVSDLEVDDVARDSAQITEDVLRGNREDHFAEAMILNAGFRMYARRDVDSLEDGMTVARQSVMEGQASEILDMLEGWSGS